MQIAPVKVMKESGHKVPFHHPMIVPLKSGRFRIIHKTMAGDAPKDFLKIYTYESGKCGVKSSKRGKSGSWPAYIAKVGHKWYPNESITEHLLTRIGQTLGVRMAESRLMWFGGQLRFLSQYFLKENEILEHGAQIFAGYLQDDELVEEIIKLRNPDEYFTFQCVEASVKDIYPGHEQGILEDFVRLLAFDAITGNNDRHYFNWGVVAHVRNVQPPVFAPVFDTARGLFWNYSESNIQKIANGKQLEAFLVKYADGSKPKIGWDGMQGINHFELIKLIAKERPQYTAVLRTMCKSTFLSDAESVIRREFRSLLSNTRQDLVVQCLQLRYETVVAILEETEC